MKNSEEKLLEAFLEERDENKRLRERLNRWEQGKRVRIAMGVGNNPRYFVDAVDGGSFRLGEYIEVPEEEA